MDGRVLIANKPITVTLTKGETLWFAENEKLDIFASGESDEAAVTDFKKHVVYFYRHYTSKPDEALTGRALELKNTFRDLFAGMTPDEG